MVVKKNLSNLNRQDIRKEIKNEIDKARPRSLLSRARSLLGLNDKKISKLLPWSKASESDVEIAFSDTTYFQKEAGKKALEVLFRNSWPSARAIRIRQNIKIARGLKINFSHLNNAKKAKEVVDDFLKRLHPTRPMLSLLSRLKNIGINTDVFGNGYWEKLFEPRGTVEEPKPVKVAKSLEGVAPIHPIHFDFKRDFDGKIIFENSHPKSYVYKKDTESYDVEIGRVAHLVYNRIGDELLGMSLLEPIYKTAERLMKIEEGITQSILTHMPLYDVVVGDESHPATKEMIDEVGEEVEGLSFKSELVHPHWVRVSQMEAYSLGKSAAIMQPFLTAISATTGVPEFALLGRGEGTNKATAQVMKDFIFQTIQPLQQADAMFIEEQIFAPLMELNNIDGIPLIEWNEITPQDALAAAKTVQALSGIFIGGKNLIDYEEARELAGLGKPSYKTQNHENIKLTKGRKELRSKKTIRQGLSR